MCNPSLSQDVPSCSALYLLSSYLPKKSVTSISTGTLQTLASLSYPTKPQDYSAILDALVAWQQADHVIKLIKHCWCRGLTGRVVLIVVAMKWTKKTKVTHEMICASSCSCMCLHWYKSWLMVVWLTTIPFCQSFPKLLTVVYTIRERHCWN